MTFVTAGLAVAGAVSILIPILIFLLWRQRRKPVEWAAMRFLLEAYRKHRRRLQVEQLLLLAIRCLAILLLGLALARPLIDASGLLDTGGHRLVYLLVDDGLASGLSTEDGESTALDRHRAAAMNIIDQLEPGDRVGVITASLPARALLIPPSTDHSSVRQLLRDLEPREEATDLAGAINQLRAALDLHAEVTDPAFAYLLSDFRAGNAVLETALPVLVGEDEDRVILRASPPSTEVRGNVSVSSIDPLRRLVIAGATDGSEQVTVRLTRRGPLDRAVSRVEMIGDSIANLPPRIVTWEQGQAEATVEFRLDFSDQHDLETGLTVRIEDGELAPDNQRQSVLTLRRRVRGTLIDRRSFGADPSLEQLTSGAWIARALEPAETSPIEIVRIEPAALRATDLRTTDVAILSRPDLLADEHWGVLRAFVDNGGLLLVVPPGEVNIHQWTDAMRDRIGMDWTFDREVSRHEAGLALADEQPTSRLLGLIAGDLASLTRPIVTFQSLGVDPGEGSGEVLLRFSDQSPMLVAGAPVDDGGEISRGLVVYFAVSPRLDWSNLPSKPLMLPLFQELVRQGLSQIRARRPVYVGERPMLTTRRAVTRLVAPDGRQIELDAARRPVQHLTTAGLYRLEDAAGREVGALAVNIDPLAALADVQAEAAVGLWLGRSGPWSFYREEDPGSDLQRAESAASISGYLLLAVLALVLIETLLARRFSHAFVGRGGSSGGGLDSTMNDVRRLAGEGR